MDTGWILGQILIWIFMMGFPVFVIWYSIKEYKDQRRWQGLYEMYRSNIDFIERNWYAPDAPQSALRSITAKTHNWKREGF